MLRATLKSIPVHAILLWLLLLFQNQAFADDILQNRLTQILPGTAQWSLVAVDLKSGKDVIVSGNVIKDPLVPGSLVKLFTAGAVLDKGGVDLGTSILHDGAIKEGILYGNLYLRGRGSSLLSANDLNAAVRNLVRQGGRKVTGDIVADSTFFDTKGLERRRNGAGYAPVGALGMDLHTVAVIVTPTDQGQPPQIKVEPPNDHVRWAVEARTATADRDSIRINQLDDTSYRISGNIRADAGPLKGRFTLHDPALYAAGALATALKQARITVAGTVKKGSSPSAAETLYRIDGPPLAGLLREMNVNSLNVVADNLLLLLGAEKYGPPGTREKGIKVVNEFLGTLGLPKGEAVLADGSGLLEENRVTARYMAEYLGRSARKDWFRSFYESLPRPGFDGTVREVGYKNERFRAKGGRLENAFALAGYGEDPRGRKIAFAFIVNLPGGLAVNLERSGAEVMRYLGTEVLQ